MTSDWECVPRSCVVKNDLPSYNTYEHPLKLQNVTVIESKGTRGSARSNLSSRTSSSLSLLNEPLGIALEGADPLSQFAKQEYELTDPLSQPFTEHENFHARKNKIRDKDALEDDNYLNWNTRRLIILNRFSTTEKLSITTSFLTTSGNGETEKIKTQSIVADKTKYRLEQLDEFEPESLQHMMNLTQQEYIQRIEQLNQELIKSWNNEQRIKALRIAIQCANMLNDITVLPFYPSQFVLITDVLDSFGKLVYERLKSKANERQELPVKPVNTEGIKYEAVTEMAINWFHKVSSIRDLLPRIYIEMALLKCQEFLPNCQFDKTLQRLANIIRGIEDPLVNIYTRCYLVRVGHLVTTDIDFMYENFQEILLVYPTIFSGTTRSELLRQRLEMGNYLSLYAPALDYIVKVLIMKQNIYVDNLLQKCKELDNNGVLLLSIMNSLKLEVIVVNALEFVNMLSKSSTEGISKGQLLRVLGTAVSKCPPLKEQCLPLLEAAFRTIDRLDDAAEFITSIETWTQFIVEHFKMPALNSFLASIHRRMASSKAFESQLHNIINIIIGNTKNIELLLVQDNFLQYMDLFHKESLRVEICKNILTVYKNNCQECQLSDEVVINALMHIGKTLNDYVSAMTVEDEKRQIGELISFFIRSVDFHGDFERQLSFYVKARGDFCNLDAVFITLVNAVNKLTFNVKRLQENKQMRKKSSGFVKACIAYCFISIPSIRSVQTQMDLYLLSGQMALLNQCLGQADASFEAALLLVMELPHSKNIETYLVSYLCNMLATLVVVPDSPDQGVLYLLRVLLDVVNKFPFDAHSTSRLTIYLHALDMLYIQSLEEFPYHIPDVVSNDELYGHDPKFVAEVNNLCAQVLKEILNQLKLLGTLQQYRTQATFALDSLLRMVRYADLSKENTFQIALNLIQLAKRLQSYIDANLLFRTIKMIEEEHELIKDYHIKKAKYLAELLVHLQTS